MTAAFLPLQGVPFTGRYGPEEALTDETLYGQADYRIIGPGYFEMRTRLLEGRLFTGAEFEAPAAVTIVDRVLANILWPDGFVRVATRPQDHRPRQHEHRTKQYQITTSNPSNCGGPR